MMKRKGEDIKRIKTDIVPDAVKKYVKASLRNNIETKTVDYIDYSTTSNDAGWLFVYPAQGVSSYQRIGDEIKLQWFSMRANLYALNTLSNTYRVIVFMTKSGTALTNGDIFRGGVGNYVFGHVDNSYVQVLHDKVYQLDSGAGYTRDVIKKIPLGNRKVTFLESTQTSEQRNIQVYLCSCSASGIPASGLVRFTGTFALGFKDA